jgi:hypothetical protein
MNKELLSGTIYLMICHTKSSMASADCDSIVSKSSNCSKVAIGKFGRDIGFLAVELGGIIRR